MLESVNKRVLSLDELVGSIQKKVVFLQAGFFKMTISENFLEKFNK